MTSLVFILIFIVGMPFVSLGSVGNNPWSKFEQAERALLGNGHVLVVDKSGGEPKGRVEAAILINAPIEQVWNVLVDCPHAPDFVPGLKNCQVLRREGDTETIEHHVKFSWLIPEVTYIFEAEYRMHHRIDFRRTGGDLKDLEGSWVLQTTGDGNRTLVVYSVYLEPGFFIPKWLVRFTLQGDLPELMKSIRHRVSEVYPP